MTINLLHMLLKAHNLLVVKVCESSSPEYFHDVVFQEDILHTLGYDLHTPTLQINTEQFPEEIVSYRKFDKRSFRLYFLTIDINL